MSDFNFAPLNQGVLACVIVTDNNVVRRLFCGILRRKRLCFESLARGVIFKKICCDAVPGAYSQRVGKVYQLITDLGLTDF